LATRHYAGAILRGGGGKGLRAAAAMKWGESPVEVVVLEGEDAVDVLLPGFVQCGGVVVFFPS